MLNQSFPNFSSFEHFSKFHNARHAPLFKILKLQENMQEYKFRQQKMYVRSIKKR